MRFYKNSAVVSATCSLGNGFAHSQAKLMEKRFREAFYSSSKRADYLKYFQYLLQMFCEFKVTCFEQAYEKYQNMILYRTNSLGITLLSI